MNVIHAKSYIKSAKNTKYFNQLKRFLIHKASRKVHLAEEEHAEQVDHHEAQQHSPPDTEAAKIGKMLEAPDHRQTQTPQARYQTSAWY